MRTHRRLQCFNYIVSFQDHDDSGYMEWAQLKRHLSRAELIQFIRNIKQGKNYISGLDNPTISQVIGV